MATGKLDTVLGRLRRLFGAGRDEGLTDGHLLERFARRGDEDAFGALMTRHGPMVLGVCRRLLGEPAAADDAFQATFLLLVRKAATLHRHPSLAGWLHTVAYRVALRARANAARRRRCEEHGTVNPTSDPSEEAARRDLHLLLDEELARLAEKYRLPLVLCYLEGKTLQEAAVELGWPKGTVAGRLARGRDILRGRLTRRGLALSTASLTTLLETERATAALPPTLAAATRRAAALVATGTGVAGTVPVQVSELIEGVTNAMRIDKLRNVLLAVAVAGLLAGVGLVTQQLVAARPDVVGPVPASAAAPGPNGAGEKARRVDFYHDPLPAGAVARMGTLRFRTEAPASAIAFFPDGKALAVATWDQTVEVLAVPDGKRRRRIGTSGQPAVAVAVSPDGKLLATANNVGSVSLWDAVTGRRRHELRGHKGEVSAVVFSPDGKLLATSGGDLSVRLWEPTRGTAVRRIDLDSWAHTIAFSPDGKTLATGTHDGKIRLWEVASGQERRAFTGHTDNVAAVAFSADGKMLASGGDDSMLRLWNPRTGKELRSSKGDEGDWVLSVALRSDGRSGGSSRTLAVAVLDGTVRLLDAVTLKERRRFTRHLGASATVAFSRDGKQLAAVGDDQKVSLWEAATGKDLTPGGGHAQGVSAVALLAGGKELATASNDRSVRLWDTADGKERRRLERGETAVSSLAASPDGKLLACGGNDGKIVLRDAADGKVLREIKAHADVVCALAFSADGKTLVSWDWRRTIHVWNVAAATGRRVEAKLTFDVMPLDTRVAAIAPDGKTVFVGGDDGRIRVLEAASGKEVAILGAVGKALLAVAVSRDGKTLASGGLGQVLRLWDAKTGKEIRRLPQQKGTGALAFSPDGKRLAVGSLAGAIGVWDLKAGKEAATFEGHRARVTALVFSEDGSRLVSGSEDTTALVWDVRGPGKGR